MKIIVDHQKCFGYASCVESGPDVYVLDEEGYNRMQPFKVKPGFEEQARSGACACPVQAIAVIEEAEAQSSSAGSSREPAAPGDAKK